MIGQVNIANASGYVQGYPGTQGSMPTDEEKSVVNPGESTVAKPGKTSSPAECQTCKNRKYQDGSNEMVSFKAAAHISPTASASAVMSHEQEHVANAYEKAARNNGTVLAANVKLQTAVCPECGRSYVSGGTTSTSIKYSKEPDPYKDSFKDFRDKMLGGMNFKTEV